MPRGERQSVVSARVPAKVKEELDALAAEKGVNLSEYLRWTLIEHASRIRSGKQTQGGLGDVKVFTGKRHGRRKEF